MDYKLYSNKKEEFDNKVFLYIAKRLFDDLDESDAAQENIIDGVGNVLKEPNGVNNWSFTSLDRLLLLIRQQIGEKELRNVLNNYEFVKDVDSLFIISNNINTDFSKLRDILGSIVTKVEDKSYLPDYLYHDNNEEYINEDDNYSFNDKVRRALTVATFILYGVRNDKVPNIISYDKNIIPSVELTFGIRSWGSYEDCFEFCQEHGLTEFDKVTGEGIRLIVMLAKLFVEGNLLINDSTRVENQHRNWSKLAKERL